MLHAYILPLFLYFLALSSLHPLHLYISIIYHDIFSTVDHCNGVIAGLSTAFAVTVILVITFFAFLLYRKKSCNSYRSKLNSDDCEESRVNELTESREATPEASDMPEEMTDAETTPERHSSLKRSSAIPKELKPLIPTSELNLHIHAATFHIKNLS